MSLPRLIAACPICKSPRLHYAFSTESGRIVRCADCRLMLTSPQCRTIKSEEPGLGGDDGNDALDWSSMIARYRGAGGGKVLHVPRGLPSDLPTGTDAAFDVCVLRTLDQATDPIRLLEQVRRSLHPAGAVAVLVPSLDSRAARRQRSAWPGFAAGRLTFFDRNTLQSALFLAGFSQIVVHSAGSSGEQLLALARPSPPAKQKLSIIVPAFNEAATVGPLLDSLVHKEIEGLELEIIVVESNSTDGTREVLRQWAGHPGVVLVLQERPRGKGNAVRAGLARATGDFVLIQDADLEYDLEDYDVLLEPLVSGREALVLGARHGGNAWWKMRQFSEQPALSLFFNFGHWLFTALLNTLFRQRLRDPFTMFKVFRRDCLYGLSLQCNRFDFDYELLIKMIRKGYRPVEIPVNYRSRSFKDGKKVSTFRDPLNWLWTLAKLRFVRIDPMLEIERARGATEPIDDAIVILPQPRLSPSRAEAA